MKFRLPTPLLAALFLSMATSTPCDAQRDTILMNRNWLFCRGTTSDPSELKHRTMETVHLPHDFQISQPWKAPDADERADSKDAANNTRSRLSARGFKEMGTGWYRYVWRPDSRWKGRRAVLDFEGIMLVGDVWLNGERIGGTDYGYLGFEVDVTDRLRMDADNELIVKADTRQPDNSRWYTGGGLFRGVRMILTDRNLYFARHPLAIRTTDNRMVDVRAEIVCRKRQKQIPVLLEIIDAEGKVVKSQQQRLDFNARWRDREYDLQTVCLDHPRLWSCDSPYLYRARVTVFDEQGNVSDQVTEPFGVRTIEFSPEYGLKVNGKKTLLKGYANHHTLGALGAAAFPRAIEKRIQLMKSFGFNHIRTAHNPYSEDFLRLCDRYGMLVVDELYDKWLTKFAGGRADWTALWQRNIAEWVCRDRNHPSVVLWSLGNELQQYSNLPFNDWGVTVYRLMRQLLQRYDSTRLTTVAMHPRYRSLETDSLPAPLALATDVASYNYRYMYFPGDHQRFPDKVFYQSEASVAQMGLNFYEMNLDQVVGLAYWGAIDYLGESMGWPLKGWNKGVFDISLQPKPQAYFVKSMFSAEPVVHIGVVEKKAENADWNGVNVGTENLSENWNLHEGATVDIVTFTNADEVRLMLNGHCLGVQRNDSAATCRNRIVWKNIRYKPGKLVAVALKNGKETAHHQLETAGPATQLRMEADKAEWNADGQDLMHIRITATDRKGRKVCTATDRLHFRVEGPAEIIATDNGDLTSNEVHTDKSRCLYNGTALVILRAGQQAGRVTLHAECERLKCKPITLNVR